ncbi:hypothetical protein SCHPADRAFT_946188 [Schizopora paradoxa]|uniref:Survival Motor Neuron Gemin2-binding domain-containing protein n=1 Tax=Schizopora paradoxa TaxID=27342 RepID=A0A0H2R4P4_9AGAM|nr:hypothetical protein SCHPADRAFT_946188 [Schizopora paradoxa]
MARQIVSYDDLAAPENPPSSSSNVAQNSSNSAPLNINNNRPVSTRSAVTPATQPDFIGPVIPIQLQETTGSEGDQSGSPAAKRRKMNTQGGQGGHYQNHRNAQHNNGGKQKGKWKNNKRSGPEAYGSTPLKSGYGAGSVVSINGASVGRHPTTNVQHWDEPELEISEIGYEEQDTSMAQGDESMKEVEMELSEDVDEEDEEDEDESRELNHEEIWDDSALIEAWDAANEEYEAIHGKNKNWKKERVHKSPLWYNKPPENLKKDKGKEKVTSIPSAVDPIGVASKPASTSRGDASLSFTVPEEPHRVPAATGQVISDSASHYAGLLGQGESNGAEGVEGSVDEAFTRALGAMYWTGYWTAIYHARRGASFPADGAALADAVEENDEEEERLDHELTEALISTQR